MQALDGLNDAHPCWGGQTHLLSPLIQMLISLEKNALTDTPGNNS